MRNDLTSQDRRAQAPLEHDDGGERAVQPWPPLQPLHGMFGFRYASTELFEENGQLHVRIKQTHYQDGRLRSEECEGVLDRDAAERMVMQAQQQLLSQAFGIARLLLAPFLTRR